MEHAEKRHARTSTADRSTTPKSGKVVGTMPSLCASKGQQSALIDQEPKVGMEVLATIYAFVLTCRAEEDASHFEGSTNREVREYEQVGSDA
jgi:hypothetical protein